MTICAYSTKLWSVPTYWAGGEPVGPVGFLNLPIDEFIDYVKECEPTVLYDESEIAQLVYTAAKFSNLPKQLGNAAFVFDLPTVAAYLKLEAPSTSSRKTVARVLALHNMNFKTHNGQKVTFQRHCELDRKLSALCKLSYNTQGLELQFNADDQLVGIGSAPLACNPLLVRYLKGTEPTGVIPLREVVGASPVVEYQLYKGLVRNKAARAKLNTLEVCEDRLDYDQKLVWDFAEDLQKNHHTILALTKTGAAAACVVIDTKHNSLDNVRVLSPYRDTGLGKLMVEEAVKLGARKLQCVPALCNWYSAMGWQVSYTGKKYVTMNLRGKK